jgi:Hemerythrin HHE cation binding domain
VTATEDLLTPIHKAIRAMIYDLGGHLQTTDFSDPTTSAPILADLKHDFASGVSRDCVLSMVHAHVRDEDTYVYPRVRPFDASGVDLLIDEHREVADRLVVVARMADEVVTAGDPVQRIEAGRRVNREANEFFAFFLGHMNREEASIGPVLQDHFTNEEIRRLRGEILRAMPPDRFAVLLRWMLPALNVQELGDFLADLKRTAPPEFLRLVRGIAAANVDPDRWHAVKTQLNL